MNTPETKHSPQSHRNAPSCPPKGENGSTQPGGGDKMLACPWCGGQPEYREMFDGNGFFGCSHLGCPMGPGLSMIPEKEAITAWNARADDGKDKRIADLEQGNRELVKLIGETVERFERVRWGWDGDCGSQSIIDSLEADAQQLIEQHGGTL